MVRRLQRLPAILEEDADAEAPLVVVEVGRVGALEAAAVPVGLVAQAALAGAAAGVAVRCAPPGRSKW